MNANKKVILIVILGVGACLLSALISRYFLEKNQNDQRLLSKILQLTEKIEIISLLRKDFIQNGNPDTWRKINQSLKFLEQNVANDSARDGQWRQKRQGLKEKIFAYHHLMSRIHDPAIRLNAEKGNLQRIGLSFSTEVRDRIIAPYRKEEGVRIYQGRRIDPIKMRIKDTAYDLMGFHIQQQLILTELLLDWDLAGYRQKKKIIAEQVQQHKTQLHYLNLLMGNDPGIGPVIASLEQKLSELIHYEQHIIKNFSELDRINKDLVAEGDKLLRKCTEFSNEIMSAIARADTLNRHLNWTILLAILCGLSFLGAMLAKDIIRFVTDLQESREKYRISEKMLKDITDNVPGVVFQFKSTGDHIYSIPFISAKTAEIFELMPDTTTFPDHFLASMPKEGANRFITSIRAAVDDFVPWYYEGRFTKPSGKTIWFSVTAIPQKEGEDTLFYGFLTDISQRRQMEEDLRLTQFIFDKAPIGIWRIGADAEILDVNEQGCTSLGYSRDELCRMTVFDFAPGYDIKTWKAGSTILNEIGTRTIEARHQRKNGEIFPIQVIQNLMRYEEQEFRVAFVQDITEHKGMEESLSRLRNYLSNIIDSMPSVLVAVDLDVRVTQWNRHTEKITGLNFEQARSQPLAEVFPSLAGEIDCIKTAIRQRRVISLPKVPVKAKPVTRFENVTIFPLTANGVEGAVIRVDDVTEQVRMEEMMIQSEKMLSVGGLAAGMAHEINNPLAGMMQTAGVMAGRLGSDLDIPANRRAAREAGTTVAAVARFMELRGIPKMLESINESGRRVAEIVENMLSFARKSEASVSTHDLGKLFDKTLELAVTDYDLKRKYDFKRITIEKDYADPPVSVPCEGTKIQQVLLNIMRNGAEAMGDIASPRFVFRTLRQGDTAVMEIEDNGPGMDEQTRKRIFEPFFTTKPVGVGTGLGLSVSYFIITENHGGEMTVKSSPGAGTTFRVRLPMKGKSVG